MTILEWIKANQIASLAIALWIIANITPRPHPETQTGAVKTFWTIIDRLCLLTAGAIPGSFKLIFVASPSLVAPSAAPKDNATPTPPEPPKVDKEN